MTTELERSEKTVRFGCGLVFGFLVAAFVTFLMTDGSLGVSTGVGVAAALLFGFASVKCGDGLWLRLRHFFIALWQGWF